MSLKQFIHRAPVVGGVVCLLVLAYFIGAIVLGTDSSGETTAIGHSVEGDPLAGLTLDPSLYGTETDEENRLVEECYESKTGASRPEQIVNPTFDQLYAWRECAVELGIESKVMMFEPISEQESRELAAELEARTQRQVSCLRSMGWDVIELATDESGSPGFEVVADRNSVDEERLADDAAQCSAQSESLDGHDH